MRWTRMTTCAAAIVASVIGISPVAAQSGVLDRLQIHGHLSQGYVTSSDMPIFGIPTNGSTDYRNAALQFRYGLTDNDHAVLQLKHRRLGESVLTESGSDLELAWAFYQRRFGNASVRIGRVPLPDGIFNETRDVGTLLPFYRAPANSYAEGIETIDGIIGSYDLSLGSWGVEASAGYGGLGFRLPYVTPEGATVIEDRVENYATGQLWVNTPLRGARVGFSGAWWKSPNALGVDVKQDTWTGSVDVVRDRGFVRGEYREVEFADFTMTTYYAQGGVYIGRFSVNGQADFADVRFPTSPIGPYQYQAARDLAAGVNFRQSANLVYKLEAHRARGSNFDVYVEPLNDARTTSYFIGSVSVSF